MKRAKRATIYVAAGLFVAAAAAKLLFPARTSETIRTVEESFHRADYRTEETVAGVTEAANDAAMPVTVTINAAEFLGLTEPAGTEELSPAVEEAMSAFMEEQRRSSISVFRPMSPTMRPCRSFPSFSRFPPEYPPISATGCTRSTTRQSSTTAWISRQTPATISSALRPER